MPKINNYSTYHLIGVFYCPKHGIKRLDTTAFIGGIKIKCAEVGLATIKGKHGRRKR